MSEEFVAVARPRPILGYQAVSQFSQPGNDNDPMQRMDPDSLLTLETHQAVLDKIKEDDNTYATSKSTSQSLLNLSVIQSQISLLVAVIASPLNGWSRALITLLTLSLTLQLVIFVLLVILAKSKTEAIGKFTATGINALVTTLSGVLLMNTSAITAVSKFSNTTLV